MKILTTLAEIRALQDDLRVQRKTIGVMGTSGRMHAGHASLLERAVAENDVAIMIWMGHLSFSWLGDKKPTSFYDRDWDTDRALAESTGLQYAYLPEGDDFTPRPALTVTLVPMLTTGAPPMEDISHLNECSSSTAKIYGIFPKMRYYSGEKDWQQLAIFRRMAEDLSTEIEVVGCDVVREPDGLAMSSRNVRLTPEERAIAPAFHAALQAGKAAIEGGERSSEKVVALVSGKMAEIGEVIYVHAVTADTLQPMETLQGDIRLIASLKLGLVPLVDNVGAFAG